MIEPLSLHSKLHPLYIFLVYARVGEATHCYFFCPFLMPTKRKERVAFSCGFLFVVPDSAFLPQAFSLLRIRSLALKHFPRIFLSRLKVSLDFPFPFSLREFLIRTRLFSHLTILAIISRSSCGCGWLRWRL